MLIFFRLAERTGERIIESMPMKVVRGRRDWEWEWVRRMNTNANTCLGISFVY